MAHATYVPQNLLTVFAIQSQDIRSQITVIGFNRDWIYEIYQMNNRNLLACNAILMPQGLCG